ncbi:DUF554 domain-containing protein [candidate division WOR-3 bacterium]|nr:DUF554 domain-containing protein [candidate division WOR-3 bacterium]
MIGVIMNTVLVIIGGCTGLLFRKGIPEKIKRIIMTGLGLFTCILGIKMGLEMQQVLVVVLSIVAGGAIGQVLRIEENIKALGERIRVLMRLHEEGSFSEGFVFSSLLFCVGPMTILGCIQAGVEGDPELLFIKSIMDGVSAIILASALGMGVLLSAVTVLILQGTLVLLAQQFTFLTQSLYIGDFTSVGGIIIFGIGIKLLGIKKLKAGNFLPALVLVVLFTFLATLIRT